MSVRSLVAAAVIALGVSSSALAAPSLTVGTVTGQAGSTVNVPVTLTNDAGISALQFDLLFDSTKIASVGTPVEGTALATVDHDVDSNLVATGRFRVLVLSMSLGVIPSGQLVVIPMRIAAGVTGSITLTLSDAELVDANVNTFSSSGNGTINVGAACMPGDVNVSGRVTSTDVLLLKRKAASFDALIDRDRDCGNLSPFTLVCTFPSGKLRICVTPLPPDATNFVTSADVLQAKRLVVELTETSCAACAPQVAPSVVRVAGDVAPRGVGDGRVDVSDVVLALRYSVGLEATTADSIMADVAPAGRDAGQTLADGNGVVDIADAVLMLRTAVGLEQLAWAERQLDVVLPSEAPRIGFGIVVSGWPATAQVLGMTSTECAGDDGEVLAGTDRWGIICGTDPQVVSAAGTLATVRYRGPRIDVSRLNVESQVVAPSMDETSGVLVLQAR